MSEFHSRRAVLQSAGSAVTLEVLAGVFGAAGKQHGPTLVADVPHFSSVMPIAFPTTIYGVG
jgi:hypothetical protein